MRLPLCTVASGNITTRIVVAPKQPRVKIEPSYGLTLRRLNLIFEFLQRRDHVLKLPFTLTPRYSPAL